EARDADDVVDTNRDGAHVRRNERGQAAARVLRREHAGEDRLHREDARDQHAAHQFLRIVDGAGRQVIGRPLEDLQVLYLYLRRERQVRRRDDDAGDGDSLAAALLVEI